MASALHQRLSKVDLNLLPVLLVLIETQSTQLTADRIGRSQSAVSHALNRLREMLGDPLFIRHGPALQPTPLLAELQEPLRQLLFEVTTIVSRGATFDAPTSTREIVIGCPDIASPLAMSLCKTLQQQGPQLTFRITSTRQGSALLKAGEIDLMLSLYRNKAEHGQDITHIGALKWGFYTGGKCRIAKKPSAAHWCSRPHVQVHTGKGGRTPIDDAASIAGVTREIGLKVNSFMEALFVASQGEMFFTTFPALAHPVALALRLKEFPLPLDVHAAPLSIVTRQTRFDPMSQWLHEHAVRHVERALLSSDYFSMPG